VQDIRMLPPDTAQRCDDVCKAIGLSLQAVVVVSDRTGCVCERAPAGLGHAAAGASAAAAGTLIAIEEEEQAAAAQAMLEQQQQDLQPPPFPQ